ncbi:GILT-like protein C02D5.2 [Orchesella cincta]|uniref:GILT-like protein C02D5.2 n=1 Tax=Orchesella cincta TaxID=48709 RepID=A0A1D2NGR4_ORCCI|nr:GILT-like protein C02D5.2 [Orchesella cincta]
MAASYPPDALDDCATKLNFEKAEITKCMEGKQGSELLASNGNRTHGLSPKLYFVPWITINGIFDQQKFQESLSDFKTVICKELHDDGKTPEGCDGIELLAKQVDVRSGSESSWVQQPRDALVQLLATFCFLLAFM